MTYSEEEWLGALRECKQKHGKVTPSVFKNDPEFPSCTGAAKRFDSWARAKELAGVADGETAQCSGCGRWYRHLIKHWNDSDCALVTPSDEQLAVLTGILMGDGTLLRDGKTAAVSVEMTNHRYLRWLDSELGMLSTGVSVKHTEEEQRIRAQNSQLEGIRNSTSYKSSYLLLTRKHPDFNQFRQWYATDEKQYPTDLAVTPTILRHWYCCDGTLNISAKKSNPEATIICKNESHREEFVVNLLEDAGFDVYVRDGRFRFPVAETRRLLDWIAPAPPGFEYKWAQSYEEYRRLQNRME